MNLLDQLKKPMTNLRLKLEICETQVWLMFILAFLILHFAEDTVARLLGWLVLGWGLFTLVTIEITHEASKEEDHARPTDTGREGSPEEGSGSV